MRKILPVLALVVILGCGWSGLAAADEVTDQIELGLKLYKEGNINEALSELEFALAQIRQKKAEGMGDLFPEPPSGWTAQEFESQAVGGGALGSISASRQYDQTGGQGRVDIEIISDSPMITSLAMVLGNPMVTQGDKRTKLIKVAGQRALLKQKSKSRAELTFIVANKIMVTVKARRIPEAAKVVKDFGTRVNIKKLKELAQ